MARLSHLEIAQTQKAFEDLYNTMSRIVESPLPNLEGMANRIAVGADHLRDTLDALGLKCSCRSTPYQIWSRKYTCTCTRAKEKVSLYGIDGLSGKGCRYKQGRFVPVPQCIRARRKITNAASRI